VRRIVVFALAPAILLTLVASSWTVAVAAPARLTPTTGAVKLNAAQTKVVEKVRCGQVGKSWLPGATVGGKFLTHSKRAANYTALAKRASGKQAASLRAQAAKYTKLGKSQATACKQPNGAKKLAASKLKKVGSGRTTTQCGNLGTWVPGTLAAGYFTSHSQQATNFTTLARFSKGAAKRAAQAQAASFKTKHSQQSAACKGGTPPKPGTPLKLNLSGAAGLALTAPGSANSPAPGQPGAANADGNAGSNLDVVTPDGQVKDAVTSGKASVSKFLIAPNDKAYLLFQQRVNLTDTSQSTSDGCLLAEASLTSDTPTCVDSSLISLWWGTSDFPGNPIQFDATGAVYYAGSVAGGKTVLRRYANGTSSDLIPADNVRLDGFLVLSDGSVFIAGSTTSTMQAWTRRVPPQGGLQTIAPSAATFLDVFPDGNVYFGVVSPPLVGVKRFLTSGASVDPKQWIGGDAWQPTDTYNNGEPVCRIPPSYQSYCARLRGRPYHTLSNKTYALHGISDKAALVRLYPDVAQVTTSVSSPTIMQGVLNHLILAGRNSSGQNVLYLHDTADDSERELLGPSNEIEIYHLSFSAVSGKVMFDGLRFADNKYVLGEVNVNTGDARTVAALGAKWEDFQTFG
jgi:hypothetical protein